MPDYHSFRNDLAPFSDLQNIDRPRLIRALKRFSRIHDLNFNWDAIERVVNYELLVSLCIVCPFEPREKQALLECNTPDLRFKVLTALMEMAVAAGSSGTTRQ